MSSQARQKFNPVQACPVKSNLILTQVQANYQLHPRLRLKVLLPSPVACKECHSGRLGTGIQSGFSPCFPYQ